jgi:hypothetical protein
MSLTGDVAGRRVNDDAALLAPATLAPAPYDPLISGRSAPRRHPCRLGWSRFRLRLFREAEGGE